MNNIFTNFTNFTHSLVKKVVNKNDIVIDATAGNGKDTVFLAQLVDFGGLVYAFDIQKQAIINTRENLIRENLLDRVKLINDSHANLEKYITESVSCIMFNLGYLPGSNHSIITLPDSTLKALNASLKFIKANGLISIMVYTGHPGGEEEKNAIESFVSKLPREKWLVLKWYAMNKAPNTPYLILIYKREEKNEI